MISYPQWKCICIFFLCLPLLCKATTKDQDTLQSVFSSALSDHGTSFRALTSELGVVDTNGSHGYKEACLQHKQNFTALGECLRQEVKCLSIRELEQLYSISSSKGLTSEEAAALSPALVFSLLACHQSNGATYRMAVTDSSHTDHDIHKEEKPSTEATWGYSFLFVTVINLCSLTGALVLPCMKMKSYKVILMFMVGIAVGTLVGSSLLFLIPEAFRLTHDGDMGYIWKASTIMGGVYLFYLIEKLLRFINFHRENTSLKKRQDEEATKDITVPSFQRNPVNNSLPGRNPPDNIPNMCYAVTPEEDDAFLAMSGSNTQSITNGNKANGNGHSHTHGSMMDHKQGEVAPVAYMIIFGDALHNFIDGLSIGSAFTVSTMTGVSISVACLCEELPHELGDFAILLNSGMSIKRALSYNFLSACTCYLGTAVGIFLGVNTSSSEWIFAVAGGMFLYIALVDMMPEMNSAAESDEGRQLGSTRVFLIQNAGLLIGYGIMLVMAIYGGEIIFEE